MQKIDAMKMAYNLMTKYGITCELILGNSKRFLGYATWNWDDNKGKYVPKSLELSTYLIALNNEDEVRNTILHEIAHLLTCGHHHDWVWKMKCREIGCDPKRLNTTANMAKGRYTGVCDKCGKDFSIYRKPKYFNQVHRQCGGRVMFSDSFQRNNNVFTQEQSDRVMSDSELLQSVEVKKSE